MNGLSCNGSLGALSYRSNHVYLLSYHVYRVDHAYRVGHVYRVDLIQLVFLQYKIH